MQVLKTMIAVAVLAALAACSPVGVQEPLNTACLSTLSNGSQQAVQYGYGCGDQSKNGDGAGNAGGNGGN